MSLTPLALIKAQLNLDTAYDDALLTHYAGTAEEWIGAYIGQPFADHDPVPACLTHAVLLLVTHWYVERSALSELRGTTMPFGVLEILSPHRLAVTGHDHAA